jgi:hypothetical protein
METFSPPHPTIDLSAPLYYQLVYTLTDLLPPPLDDSPEALRARNHAARRCCGCSVSMRVTSGW